MAELSVYHGTIKQRGDRIVQSQAFLHSNKPKEWLGTGVYFFQYYSDAREWAKLARKSYKKEHKMDMTGSDPVVLKVAVKFSEDQYCDLDDRDNVEKVNAVYEAFLRNTGNAHPIRTEENDKYKNIIDNALKIE